MKKLCLILSLIFTFSIPAITQTSVWKVEGKENTIYIGGTIHLLTQNDYPLPSEFDDAYEKSDRIVLEADLKKMESPDVVQKLMTMVMFQDDRTLKTVLKEEVYKLLEDECSKFDISLQDLSKFKPSMVILFYSLAKMQKSGDIVAGVDNYYFSKAETDNKSLLFLETVDSQLNLLFGEEDGNEDEIVMQFFDDQNKMDKLGADLKDNWFHGKDTILIKLQEDMKKEYPDIYQKILVDRNNNWIPLIDSYLDSEEIEFILVGALHLPGKDGILEMLKSKGYRINQL